VILKTNRSESRIGERLAPDPPGVGEVVERVVKGYRLRLELVSVRR
jgi:hypothetical protein